MTALAFLALGIVVAIAALGGALLARLDRAANAIAAGDGRERVVRAVDALLPQTQCAQCGHPGCRPYAEAIVDGAAGIDRCPPGGTRTVQALATLLGRDIVPIDASRGETKDPQVARIEEADCIGCALCLPACPVDAIVGARQLMHTVIRADCTGCELCIAPCPVDCIVLEPRATGLADWHWPAPSSTATTKTIAFAAPPAIERETS